MPQSDAVHDADAAARDAALVHAARTRVRRGPEANDRRSGVLTGGTFLAVVAGWLALAPPRSLPAGALAACVAAYVVASSVEFEIGPGCALPTTPVQVVMLFLLPPPLVPVSVVAGLWTSAGIGRMRDPERRERALVLAGSGWQVLGPAVVFAVAHAGRPALSAWPVYALALAAQLAGDAAASYVRNCYGLGVSGGELAAALRFTFLCDLALAPVGLAAVLAVPGSPAALLFLLPPTGLLAMLQSDRRKHLDQTIALGVAYTDTSNLARRDVLTGVFNRLAFEETTARFEQLDAPIGVVLADVDGLKVANDTQGHEVGDQLIVAVALVLSGALPASSGAVAFRTGGDEFAILYPFASVAATLELVSAVRSGLAGASALAGGVPVSASTGAGYAPTGRALGKAIAKADRGVNDDKVRRGVRRR